MSIIIVTETSLDHIDGSVEVSGIVSTEQEFDEGEDLNGRSRNYCGVADDYRINEDPDGHTWLTYRLGGDRVCALLTTEQIFNLRSVK